MLLHTTTRERIALATIGALLLLGLVGLIVL